MRIAYIVALVTLSFNQLVAQTDDADSTRDFAAELALLEAELDSGGIFQLIDSILKLEFSEPASELNMRFGYSSNVTNGGRNFGINQYGLSPGVSFYHKSGLYADLSGFWNSEFEPHYNITIASLGYLGKLGASWNYSASFDQWFYHTDEESEIAELPDKSVNTSLSFFKKHFNASLDYSYLFGPQQAHRLTATIAGKWKTTSLIKNTTISIQPTASMLYGNQSVIIQFNGRLVDELRSNEYLQKNLQSEEFSTLIQNLELTQEDEQRLFRIQNNRFLSDERKRNLTILFYLNNEDVREYLYNQLEIQNEEYGIMNYNLSLPVTINFKQYLVMLAYSYSIPVELPGETFELDPIGLFSFTFVYRIPFK